MGLYVPPLAPLKLGREGGEEEPVVSATCSTSSTMER